ncbi:MAG: hypothetical protein JNM07_02580 [Phycisphaerae bacterium]|nr:hypothetical protein [Phycisphaerae bacterium]
MGKVRKAFNVVLALAIVGVLGFVLIGVIANSGSSRPMSDKELREAAAKAPPEPPKREAAAPTPETDKPKEKLFDTGDEVVIYHPDSKRVMLAASKEAWSKYEDALRAKDEIGVAGMVAEGKLFTLGPGTKCKVLDLHGWAALYEVRVYEGGRIGRVGFVPTNRVRKAD